LYLTCTYKRTLELKPNYIIPINLRKPTMAPKVSLSKRPTSTREEYEVQLGSEIEDNNNVIGVYKQIRALAANWKVNCL